MRLLCLALLLTGCGYTFRPERGMERTAAGQLPSVAVVPFDNRTFRRGLEIRLTRLVADELRARAPHAPRSPAEADWRLSGAIVRADERIYSEDRNDEVRESSFVVTVQVVLQDRATEKVLRTYSFTERAPFSVRAGRIATLEQAQEEALRDLAEHIVYWLESREPEKTS